MLRYDADRILILTAFSVLGLLDILYIFSLSRRIKDKYTMMMNGLKLNPPQALRVFVITAINYLSSWYILENTHLYHHKSLNTGYYAVSKYFQNRTEQPFENRNPWPNIWLSMNTTYRLLSRGSMARARGLSRFERISVRCHIRRSTLEKLNTSITFLTLSVQYRLWCIQS